MHGRYERTLVDVPAGCREVVVRLSVRRFRCTDPGCTVVTFAEQVPRPTSRWARRTQPVTTMLAGIGLVLAGRAGARLAEGLGVAVGRNVLLRIVRALPVPDRTSQQGLRLLGVDDFALRRGHIYGTVLVDLDTHRPIDLLPKRTTEPVAAWLRDRPGIEVVCRDRAGAYAQAAAEAIPSAIQVADRWHLWHNLAQHVERAVTAHRRCWSPPPHQALPDRRDENASGAASSKEPEPTMVDPPSKRQGGRRGGRLAARGAERWQLVHGLLDDDLSLNEISRRTKLSRGTVRRFARAEAIAARPWPSAAAWKQPRYPPRLPGPAVAGGNTNAADLLRQLRARGYRGSETLLRQYVHPWRTVVPDGAEATDRSAPPQTRSVGQPMTTRDVTRWICTRPSDLEDDQATALTTVLNRCEHLNRLAEHVRAFARILATLAGDQLNTWIGAVQHDVGQPQLMSFVRGVLADYDAVRAGLTVKHNSGPVEGNVNRIKMIKRKMYGRANLDLLRALVVLGP